MSRDPIAWMYRATLVLSIGSGAWFSCWAIFFIRSIGLSPAEFAVGVTVVGVLGLAVGSPLGYVADRLGTREVLVATGVVQGVAVLCYALVDRFWVFLVVSIVAMTAERIAPGLRTAVISGLTSGSERLRCISTNRVVFHIGLTVGAGLGVVVLTLDSRPAYLALIVLYGTAIFASAAAVLRVPHVPSMLEREERRGMLVLRDRPFLVLTFLSGVLALNWAMVGTGLPLWITTHTDAPLWTVGVVTALNAVGIILFQNRVSRGAATVPSAARMAVRCGVVLALSCLLFASTYHGSGMLVVVLLVLAAAVHVVGEMLFVASGWGLAVGLTPKEAHGEYQSTFAAGPAAALMIAPAVMTTFLVGWGAAGWVALGALFLLAGTPAIPVSRWALRTRPREEVVS